MLGDITNKTNMKHWEFDCNMEVNGIMRQVWTCPSDLFKDETFYAITFDIGKELPPSKGSGYWTHYKAFKEQFPQYER